MINGNSFKVKSIHSHAEGRGKPKYFYKRHAYNTSRMQKYNVVNCLFNIESESGKHLIQTLVKPYLTT